MAETFYDGVLSNLPLESDAGSFQATQATWFRSDTPLADAPAGGYVDFFLGVLRIAASASNSQSMKTRLYKAQESGIIPKFYDINWIAPGDTVDVAFVMPYAAPITSGDDHMFAVYGIQQGATGTKFTLEAASVAAKVTDAPFNSDNMDLLVSKQVTSAYLYSSNKPLPLTATGYSKDTEVRVAEPFNENHRVVAAAFTANITNNSETIGGAVYFRYSGMNSDIVLAGRLEPGETKQFMHLDPFGGSRVGMERCYFDVVFRRDGPEQQSNFTVNTFSIGYLSELSTEGGEGGEDLFDCESMTALGNGQVYGPFSVSSDLRCFSIEVPPNACNLRVKMTSPSDADADLYVRYGDVPGEDDYDCRPYTSSSNETCTFPNPEAGIWFIVIKGYGGAVNDIRVQASFDVNCGGEGGEGGDCTGIAHFSYTLPSCGAPLG